MSNAPVASKMSPLPSTGTSSAATNSPMASQRARCIELLGGAGVQRHPGHPFVLGNAAGVEEGQVLLVDAHAKLHGDRDRPGGLDR